MGLNPLNFAGRGRSQYDNSGFENLPGKLLEAYQMPMKMKREAEDRELKNKLLEAKTNYATKMAENVGAQKPHEAQQLIDAAEDIRAEHGEGSQQDIWAQEYLQSKIKGEKGAGQGPSTKGKENSEFTERLKGLKVGSPEYKRLHEQYGVSVPRTEEELQELERDTPGGAKNAVDLNSSLLPENAKLAYIKTQDENLSKYNAMNQGMHTIEEAEKLNKENPKLWSSMTKHMQDAIDKDEGTFKAFMLSQFQNEKDKAGLDKFAKTFWKLVNTDSKISRIKGDKSMALTNLFHMKSKGGPGTTAEGNAYVLDQLRHEWSPGVYGSKALRTAQRLNYYIPQNDDIFREKYEEEKSKSGKEAQQKEALARSHKASPEELRREKNNEAYRKSINDPNSMVEVTSKTGEKFKLPASALPKFFKIEAELNG